MGLPEKFSRNAVSNYGAGVASLLAVLVATPFLVHGLGIDRYAIWALTGSIIPYVELLELGFASATLRSVAESLGRADDERVRRTVTTAFYALMVPGAVAYVVVLGLAFLLPLVFRVPHQMQGSLRDLLMLLGVDIAISIPGDTFGGVLIAFQRFDLLSGSLICVTVLQGLAWILVVKAGGGLVLLGLVTISLSLAGQLARFFLARRLLPGLRLGIGQFQRDLLRPNAVLSAWFGLGEMSTLVLANADAVIVGVVLGVPAAGVYLIGKRLAAVATKVTAPAAGMFFPYAAQLTGRRDWAAVQGAAVNAVRVLVGLSAPVCVTLALLAGPAVSAWVGPSYREAVPVVEILAVTALIRSSTAALRLLLDGTGRIRGPATIMTVEAFASVPASVVLGRFLGIRGVALGILVVVAVGELSWLIPMACRQLQISGWSILVTVLRAHVPAIVVSGSIAVALRPEVAGVPAVVGAAAAVGCAYLLTLAVTGLTGGERRKLLGALRRSPVAPG